MTNVRVLIHHNESSSTCIERDAEKPSVSLSHSVEFLLTFHSQAWKNGEHLTHKHQKLLNL